MRNSHFARVLNRLLALRESGMHPSTWMRDSSCHVFYKEWSTPPDCGHPRWPPPTVSRERRKIPHRLLNLTPVQSSLDQQIRSGSYFNFSIRNRQMSTLLQFFPAARQPSPSESSKWRSRQDSGIFMSMIPRGGSDEDVLDTNQPPVWVDSTQNFVITTFSE